jgi:hypothetical protein
MLNINFTSSFQTMTKLFEDYLKWYGTHYSWICCSFMRRQKSEISNSTCVSSFYTSQELYQKNYQCSINKKTDFIKIYEYIIINNENI